MTYVRNQFSDKARQKRRVPPPRVETLEVRNAPMSLFDLFGGGGAALGSIAFSDLHAGAGTQSEALEVAILRSDRSASIFPTFAVGMPAARQTTEIAEASSIMVAGLGETPASEARPTAASSLEAPLNQDLSAAANRNEDHTTLTPTAATPAMPAHVSGNLAAYTAPAGLHVATTGDAASTAISPVKSVQEINSLSMVVNLDAQGVAATVNGASTAQAIHAQSAAPIVPQAAHPDLQDTPPQPSPEVASHVANYTPGRGPDFAAPQGVPANVAPAQAAAPNGDGTTTPNGLSVYQNNSLGSGQGSNLNVTSEASVASNGSGAFQTGNFYDSVNGNYGDAGSWRYFNPDTTFPNTGEFQGHFCCDQRVITDSSRHVTAWLMQYWPYGNSSTGSNGDRLAVYTNTTNLLDNNIIYYDFAAINYGVVRGHFFDFPSMQVSNNYLYFTSNECLIGDGCFNTSIEVRVPLSEIAAGATIHPIYWRVNDFTLSLSNSAGGVMYAGTVTGNNSVRIWSQSEANTSLVPTDINGLSNAYSAAHTSLAPNGVNWTARSDNRMQSVWVGLWTGNVPIVGMLWNSSQGAGRPQPFVRGLVVRQSNLTNVVSQPDIWNGSYAWHYGQVAANNRGAVGGTIWIGGGTWGYPGTQLAVADGASGYGWNFLFGDNGNAASNSMGDYNGAMKSDACPNTWVGASYDYVPGISHRYYSFGRVLDQCRPSYLLNIPDVGDTRATSLNTGIGIGGGSFAYNNSMWSVLYGRRDVDIYNVSVIGGAVIDARTSLPSGGVSMDTYMRFFNAAGTQVAFNDDCGGTLYSCVTYQAPTTGTYYIGISGFPNSAYNPDVAGSGVNGSQGDYHIAITVSVAATASLRVTPSVGTVAAGTPFNVTVTALDSGNHTNPAYHGRVHFTTTDGNSPVLPPDYTFTDADAGVHVFPNVALHTAVGQTITARDTANGAIVGNGNVTVTPGIPNHLVVTSSVNVSQAGNPFDVTVRVQDLYNNTVTAYTGTVTLSSADPYGATLAGPYTFVPGDNGVHTFAGGAILYTAGVYDVTATDGAGVTGTVNVTVTPAAAVSFQADAPSDVSSGVPFDVTLTALDPYGNVDTNYADTVSWTTDDPDPSAVVPNDYTFNGGDAGVHLYSGETALVTFGTFNIFASDTNGLVGNASINVGAGPGIGGGHRHGIRPVTDVVHTTPHAAALLAAAVAPVQTTVTHTLHTTQAAQVAPVQDQGSVDLYFEALRVIHPETVHALPLALVTDPMGRRSLDLFHQDDFLGI